MICETCDGTSMISKPVTYIWEKQLKPSPIEGLYCNRLFDVPVPIGGADACPQCASRAEADYQSSKKFKRMAAQ